MRLRIDKIAPALKEDGSQDGYGEGPRWAGAYFMDCTDTAKGQPYYAKGNFKKPPVQGTEEDFNEKPKRDDPTRSICFKSSPLVEFSDGSLQPHGPEVWRMVVERVKREDRPNPYAEQGSKYGAKPVSGAVNAPQGHSRTAPTTDERAREVLTLLSRAIDGVTTITNRKGMDASPGDILTASMSLTMHLVIGMDRGDLRPTQAASPAPPAPAPVAAPVPAAPAPTPAEDAGYEPASDTAGPVYPDIPFALLISAGLALHTVAGMIA